MRIYKEKNKIIIMPATLGVSEDVHESHIIESDEFFENDIKVEYDYLIVGNDIYMAGLGDYFRLIDYIVEELNKGKEIVLHNKESYLKSIEQMKKLVKFINSSEELEK